MTAPHTKSPAPTVLMVDDVPPVLAWANRVFARAGWQVVTAESAEAAVTAWEARRAANEPVDLLISDVAMPGMDGFALVSLLRARAPELPVIILSGLPVDESTWLSGDLQRSRFLRKPVTATTLIDEAQTLLGRS